MLLKFRKSRLVGTRAYAVGEVADVPDNVASDLVKNKVATVVTEAVKPIETEKADESAAEPKPVDAKKKK